MTAYVRVYNPYTGNAKTREVTNLGWLIRHGSECNHIRVHKLQHDPNWRAHLTAYGNLPDGRQWTYHCNFADYSVALDWVKRPSLSHLTHVYHDGREPGHSEYVAVTETRHLECYGPDVKFC